jgi:hypothetical protein
MCIIVPLDVAVSLAWRNAGAAMVWVFGDLPVFTLLSRRVRGFPSSSSATETAAPNRLLSRRCCEVRILAPPGFISKGCIGNHHGGESGMMRKC